MQVNSGYCGPATFQAIDWADDGTQESQAYWAPYVGYVAGQGTSTRGIISAINNYTNWDAKASSYVMSNLKTSTIGTFELILSTNIGLHASPVVLNPLLKTRYFDYINLEHGGHFQTARGYNFDNPTHTVGIFEPYNERDYHASGAASGGLRYPSVASEFAAITANLGQVGW